MTIQAQILELLQDLQRDHGTAIVMITHDLGVVAGMADRVNVMYAGRIVETAPVRPLFRSPAHPYTSALLASIPRLGASTDEDLAAIPGSPPDLAELPPGCAFGPRCARVRDECRAGAPPLVALADDAARFAACIDSDVLHATPTEGGAR